LDPKTRAKFDKDLHAAYPKALAEVLILLGRTRWAGAPRPSRAAKAEELVNEAITRMLGGTRTWDPTNVPDLHYFLREAVRSMLSAEFESPTADTSSLDRRPEIASDSAAGHCTVDPQEDLAEQQREQLLVGELLEVAGSDPTLEKVVTALMNGVYKPNDIASATGLGVKTVYQATRKLRRRVEAARERARS
jgi:DNA-directed RNA polymerase specialized sigma24 family protein